MSLKAIWRDNTPYSKFLLCVGIILVSAIFFTLLSTLVASLIFGIGLLELNEMMTDFSNPATISVLKFIQTVSTIGTFIIPSFILAYLFADQPFDFLSLKKKANSRSALLVILALIAALPLINFLGELNSRMSLPSFLSGIENWMKESEEQAAELTKSFLNMTSLSDLLLNLFMIALLPAIGEELIFRGVIQKIFTQWLKNAHVAVWLSAILFSAMHVQFYGFIPRMMLGVMLGYLLVWSGSLWLPIIAHFVNNAAAVITTYLFREEMMKIDPDKIGTENDMNAVLISLVLTGVFLVAVYRRELRNNYSAMG